mgnify:CR=1 FL=1
MRKPKSMTARQAKELGRMYLHHLVKHDANMKALVGGSFFNSFVEGLKEAGKTIALPLKAVGKVGEIVPLPPKLRPVGFVGDLLQDVENPKFLKGGVMNDTLKDVLTDHSKKMSSARQIRGQIVKRIMKERGVSLPEASRIVKEEGLY